MVSTSKILTVSYGTFSCTLEGFDDSFDTMKAIAEYFRDLAADDRYFGAEPPTPDAEMLARIAEREIARRVEATQDQGQIVLRAQPAAATAPAPLSAPAAATPPAPLAAPVAPTPAVAAPAVAAAVAQEEDDSAEAVAQPDADTEEAATPVDQVEMDARQDTFVSPETATVSNPELAADIAEAADYDAEEDAIVDAADEAAAEFFDHAAEEDEPEDVEAADEPVAHRSYTPVPHPDQDSVASKLQRIRAVVSKAEAETDDSFSEDEHADDFLSDVTSELEEALDQDDLKETQADADENDEISSLLSSISAQAKADDQAAAEATDEEDFDFSGADFDDFDEDENDNLFESDEPEAAAQDPGTPLRARVVKMKRDEFEAAVSQGDFEEIDEDEDAPQAVAAPASSSLTPEAEAELQRELAELEAELDDTPIATLDDISFDEDDIDEDVTDDLSLEDALEDEDELSDVEEAAAAQTAPDAEEEAEAEAQETRNQFETASSDSEMGRIMAEADHQMNEPEGKNRRSAIAHLRAAVAATLAEKKAGSDLKPKDDQAVAYRDDLASVVRPRRPQVVSDGARSQRPAESRPAPLKLVAEQRVDDGEPTSRQPVRPRRVSMTALAAETEAKMPNRDAALASSGSFAEFAEEMGATKLPDLLEAAAAYMSFVEGHDQFSRPQLMSVVRQAGSGDINREDGLRSFGQLLRQGKIQKLKGGRFTVSDQINFKPDARHVG